MSTNFSKNVEREPMWDGNLKVGAPDVWRAEVEREPMWDGNNFPGFPCLFLCQVEREPMWDGNLRTWSMSHEKTLSENQCGMETPLSPSPIFPGWLSENQCGMETSHGCPYAVARDQLSENQCGMETL